MQPGTVHLLNDFCQEERVLRHAVVILQVHYDIAGSSIFRDAEQCSRTAVEIGRLAIDGRDMGPNAGGAKRRSRVDPPLVVGDGPLPFSRVERIETALSVERDVDHLRPGSIESRAKAVEILRL